MLRNFDSRLKDLEGQDIKDASGELVTLKSLAIGALMATYKDEDSLSGEQKLQRYLLATRINKGGNVELTVEELAKLKELIGKGYSVLAVGQAYQLLESD